MKIDINKYIEKIKNLPKEYKIAYGAIVAGILLILIGLILW